MFSTMSAGHSAFVMARRLRWSISPVRLHGPDALVIGISGAAVGTATDFAIAWMLPFVVLFAYRVMIVRYKRREFIVETKAAWKRWHQAA
jgi:hypothetical protein